MAPRTGQTNLAEQPPVDARMEGDDDDEAVIGVSAIEVAVRRMSKAGMRRMARAVAGEEGPFMHPSSPPAPGRVQRRTACASPGAPAVGIAERTRTV